RVAELDRRLTQFSADIAREQQQSSDAEVALARLDAEDTELKEDIKSRVEKRSGVDERVSEAETTLAAAERLFAELTTVLADLTAKRNQLEAGVRTHCDRLARLDQDIANVETEEQKLAQETSGLGDLAALTDSMETAQQNLAQSELATQTSEFNHVAARQKLEAARAPLNEADKRVQRLETEARTISKLVNGETKNLWPPIIDGVTVAKGYEKALGAALGDDLDAPVDPSAPMRWTNTGVTGGDPALPEGVEALAAHVEAPAELARRLAQIGVVAKERGAGLVSQLKTGQRLVSPEGDVWRWDGFVAAAHAPTGAARRLAERARLVDIENELERARIDASAKRQALEAADAELKAASAAETSARDAWRAAQREADAARERHANTEREINRHAARKSALTEAHSRLNADRAEAQAAHESATAALDELPPSLDSETRLAAVRTDIDGHRRLAAQVRAEAQALAREAELADRRLQAILAERSEWQNRKQSATSQIATVEARITEVTAERAELDNAPELFAQKRRALIGEIESSETARRVAADALASAESLMAE
ncbi:MAG TPA: chromosome segregation protein SMC, partial [Bradyrhizobium sp.]|nr:chromosome segregation protein SMC [Bradyrhizobium sp.]